MTIQVIVSVIISIFLCWFGGGVINGSFDLLSASEGFRGVFVLVSAFFTVGVLIIVLDV